MKKCEHCKKELERVEYIETSSTSGYYYPKVHSWDEKQHIDSNFQYSCEHCQKSIDIEL